MIAEITTKHGHRLLVIRSSRESENDTVLGLTKFFRDECDVVCHEGYFLGDCNSSLSFVNAYFLHENEMKEALAEVTVKYF